MLSYSTQATLRLPSIQLGVTHESMNRSLSVFHGWIPPLASRNSIRKYISSTSITQSKWRNSRTEGSNDTHVAETFFDPRFLDGRVIDRHWGAHGTSLQ